MGVVSMRGKGIFNRLFMSDESIHCTVCTTLSITYCRFFIVVLQYIGPLQSLRWTADWSLQPRVGHPFFSKERSNLYKTTDRSLRSFPFFIKERSDPCVLFGSL